MPEPKVMDIQRSKKKKLLNPATVSLLLVIGIAGTIYFLSTLDYATLRVDRENVLIGTVEFGDLDLEAKGRLIAMQLISKIEFQQIELDVNQKQQLVGIEEQRLQKSKENQDSQLAVLDANISQAEQNLARAVLQKANLKVTARMPGVIQEMNLDIGQTLRAGEQVGRIANQDVLYAQLDVPSLQASELARGQRVELNTRNGVIEGKISRIDPAVINGTVLVDVDIISKLPASARPELTAEGTIYIAEIRDSLYVQRPASSRSHAEQSLFRLDAEQEYAERTIVELGRVAVNHVEIMSGLSEGDQIIISDSNDWQDQSRILLSN